MHTDQVLKKMYDVTLPMPVEPGTVVFNERGKRRYTRFCCGSRGAPPRRCPTCSYRNLQVNLGEKRDSFSVKSGSYTSGSPVISGRSCHESVHLLCSSKTRCDRHRSISATQSVACPGGIVAGAHSPDSCSDATSVKSSVRAEAPPTAPDIQWPSSQWPFKFLNEACRPINNYDVELLNALLISQAPPALTLENLAVTNRANQKPAKRCSCCFDSAGADAFTVSPLLRSPSDNTHVCSDPQLVRSDFGRRETPTEDHVARVQLILSHFFPNSPVIQFAVLAEIRKDLRGHPIVIKFKLPSPSKEGDLSQRFFTHHCCDSYGCPTCGDNCRIPDVGRAGGKLSQAGSVQTNPIIEGLTDKERTGVFNDGVSIDRGALTEGCSAEEAGLFPPTISYTKNLSQNNSSVILTAVPVEKGEERKRVEPDPGNEETEEFATVCFEFSAGVVVLRDRLSTNVPEVLVIRREGSRYYEVPKGHLETGESLQLAAERELREETGLLNKVDEPFPLIAEIYTTAACDETCQRVEKSVIYFSARLLPEKAHLSYLPESASNGSPLNGTDSSATKNCCSAAASLDTNIEATVRDNNADALNQTYSEQPMGLKFNGVVTAGGTWSPDFNCQSCAEEMWAAQNYHRDQKSIKVGPTEKVRASPAAFFDCREAATVDIRWIALEEAHELFWKSNTIYAAVLRALRRGSEKME